MACQEFFCWWFVWGFYFTLNAFFKKNKCVEKWTFLLQNYFYSITLMGA